MNKIKILKTNGISGLKVHEVGKEGVTKIVDESIETDTSYILRYEVEVNGKAKFMYENGAFEIEYFD